MGKTIKTYKNQVDRETINSSIMQVQISKTWAEYLHIMAIRIKILSSKKAELWRAITKKATDKELWLDKVFQDQLTNWLDSSLQPPSLLRISTPNLIQGIHKAFFIYIKIVCMIKAGQIMQTTTRTISKILNLKLTSQSI